MSAFSGIPFTGCRGGCRHVRIPQIGARHVGAIPLRPNEIGGPEVRITGVDVSQVCPEQGGSMQVRTHESGAAEHGQIEIGRIQIGPLKVGRGEVAVEQDGRPKIHPGGTQSREVRPPERRRLHRCIRQVGAPHGRVPKVRVPALSTPQRRIIQVRAHEAGLAEISAIEVGCAQIGTRKIQAAQVHACQSRSAEHGSSQAHPREVMCSQIRPPRLEHTIIGHGSSNGSGIIRHAAIVARDAIEQEGLHGQQHPHSLGQ